MSCHGREWPKNLAIAFREFHGWANDFHAVHIPLTLEGCTEGEGGRKKRRAASRCELGCHFSYCITAEATAAAAASLRLIMSHIQCVLLPMSVMAGQLAACAVCSLLMA